jgi:acrylyl-CoA reductase (NADPH)
MMSMDTFTALVLEQRDGATHSEVRQLPTSALPEGDVLVRVAYSDLNYKDGLAITGRGRVVRSFPMVPGIDLAGTVVESASAAYKPGDEVVLTGWGIGETHWGGHAQLARVRADWLVPLPAGMTLAQSMGIGTAGFTAMLCVMALEEHGLRPGGRQVLVTGASGGVGSVAVALLARLGYDVVASTGKDDEHKYLHALGAKEVVGRLAPSGKPLESERWAGAVDTVGGATLAALIPTLAIGSSVAACGNAGGPDLHTTVFPFILRGANLLGILSVYVPLDRRRRAWERLARDLPADALDRMIQVAPLADVPSLSQAICDGKIRGRVVVDVNA